jgi:signal transduction histidine kinase
VRLDVARVRGQFASWWWDLSLRWKGLIVGSLPLVAMIPAIVVALWLSTSQEASRADARETLAAAAGSVTLQRHLVQLERAAVAGALPVAGPSTALDEVQASVERDIGSLRAAASRAASAPALASVEALLSAVDRLAGSASSDGATVGPALAEVQRRSAEVADRFTTLDRALASELASALDETAARRRQIVIVLAAGGVLAVVLGWLAMWLFTRGIVRRVQTVGEVTARVIDGETSIDVEEPGGDELGELVRELRRAAELLILHNAELEVSRDAERAVVEREQTIREVVRRVHQAVGQHDVLDATVREVAAATGSDGAFILGVEGGVAHDVLAEWTADGVPGLGVGSSLPVDAQRDANFGLLLQQWHALVIDDVVSTGFLPQTREILGELQVGSMILAPVLGEDEPLAVLVMVTSGRARPWPPGSDRLAEVVAAHVATALTHARLYEREREMVQRLRELDEAKSDFVASVSHELRTPLTSIRGYAEMLGDGDAGELTSDQGRMLEIVQRNADRLLSLIENLLTLSRIESGAFRVARVPVALDDVVRATLDELRPQAAAAGVVLEADVTGCIPAVLGDRAQLERVLFNLLSNAIKFTVDGGRVTVRLRASDDGVEMSVADRGIGIPAAELDRLFGRFFRSSISQQRAIQGTGLGLMIVKSIVEHHEGDISVESEEHVGTTFTIRLPAAPATVSVA